MKSWFVYLIDGVKYGVWANNSDEAEAILLDRLGDVDYEFLGIDYCGIGPGKADEYIFNKMSLLDRCIASGLLGDFSKLVSAR